MFEYIFACNYHIEIELFHAQFILMIHSRQAMLDKDVTIKRVIAITYVSDFRQDELNTVSKQTRTRWD